MLIGVPSGYFGGRFDVITQRFVDAWMSFPELLVLLTVMSMVGRGQLQIILVIGIFTGVRWTRVVRGAVIGIKGNDYFEAARAVGQPHLGIIVRHILPNILAPLIVIFSVSLGWAILAEASLSFLGFGLPLDVPSWGGMLSGEGRRYLERKPALADVAGHLSDRGDLRRERARRRAARPAGPAPGRRRPRALRRRRIRIAPPARVGSGTCGGGAARCRLRWCGRGDRVTRRCGARSPGDRPAVRAVPWRDRRVPD